MQNRTLTMIITAISAFVCGCLALISCIWSGMIAMGTPINVTTDGVTTPQTFSPAIGYVLLCLSLFFVLIPLVSGFFLLRKKPEVIQDVPPPS